MLYAQNRSPPRSGTEIDLALPQHGRNNLTSKMTHGVERRPCLKGLIIRSPWIEKILAGEKTWELRKKRTNIRGHIALIRGGSGLVVGTAILKDCVGPMSRLQLREHLSKHHASDEVLSALNYEAPFAWVLEAAIPLPVPQPYTHPSGAVIWVDIPYEVAADNEQSCVPLPKMSAMTAADAKFLRIPIASDGSKFLPETRRLRGYQVGEKGSEKWVDDYWEALRLLNTMSPPRWRRPNTQGNWGIVKGLSWTTQPHRG